MKTSLKIAAIIFFLSASYISAQENISVYHPPVTQTAIDNLKNGILSENVGLRRNSIYFAGKYQIKELSDALTEALEKEKIPSNKILIALALFYIGDEGSISNIKELALKDSDSRVRRMCSAIYTEYINKLYDYFSEDFETETAKLAGVNK